MLTEIEIRPAVGADLALATDWLAGEGLPTEDLTTAHMDAFWLAIQDEQAVGMVGIEQFEDIGLLRSLVVDKTCRGVGLGAQLVTALENKARRTGLRELWLLTIDADAFFARLGYLVMQRSDAPPAIQGTAEFSALCPGDAALMCKHLV
ncbi:MAG: arsenic resistance N-acetyltransferase ArsN2 [Woeseiaceae bacterium]